MSSAGYTKTESDGKRPSSNKNGDWTCPEPENQCNRCGKERPNSGSKNGSTASDSDGGGSSSAGGKKKVGTEIGKAAAEKSRGLFSAEDWQCNKCANVNWARRHTCNICSAPRFCDVEERTGYGGGYNDRGVVEYKDRVESDDEYDEFGRRKKPKASNKLLTAAHDQFHDRDRAVQIAAGGRVINVLLQNRPPRRLVTDDPIPSAPVRPVAMAGPDHGRTRARGHDPARDLLDPIDATRTGDVEASRRYHQPPEPQLHISVCVCASEDPRLSLERSCWNPTLQGIPNEW
uniref:RanBP2-type domain-containing protein n=1 Tax=Anopheles coluzzii TaxID=1518534 RepID=A0A8W7PQX5_ANOCL